VRAIPIDDFFDDFDVKRLTVGDEPVSAASFDWGRIVAEGRAARTAVDGGCWRIGHLAMLVERRYASGALQRFAEAIGESYGTVRRYRWVAKAYDEHERLRFTTLSFSHFQTVAGLPDRLTWLARAERGRWSVDRLVRETRTGGSARVTKTTPQIERLRSSIDGLRRSLAPPKGFDDAAIARAGKEWLADALDDLASDVEQLRERVRRVTAAQDKRRHLRAARNGSAKTKPAGPRAGTALKARAIAR
jgi:hypothetical protein